MMLKHKFLKDAFVIWKDGLLNSFGKIIEYLLCARHCSRYWGLKGEKDRHSSYFSTTKKCFGMFYLESFTLKNT